MRSAPLSLAIALFAASQGCGASASCASGRTCGDARWFGESAVIDGRRVVAQAVTATAAGAPAGESRGDAMRVSARGLFLHFDLSALGDGAMVDRAVLALSPHPAWRPGGRASHLVARAIVSAWTSSRVASGETPATGDSSAVVTLPVGVRAPLRVDVTAIVRAWRDHTAPAEGIALEVDTGDAVFAGVGAATLASRPRLEVVLR